MCVLSVLLRKQLVDKTCINVDYSSDRVNGRYFNALHKYDNTVRPVLRTISSQLLMLFIICNS